MNYKNLAILLTVSFTQIACYAQWGDAYHKPNNYLIEKQQREYGERQRAMAGSNTNSKVQWSTEVKIRENSTEVSGITPEQARINAMPKSYISDAEKKLMSDNQKKRSVYEDIFIKAGFTPFEAKWITINHILSYSGDLNPHYAKPLATAPLLTLLKQNVSTMAFDNIQTKLDTILFYAPISSLQIIEKIAPGFKDRQAEIEELQINSIVSYFNLADISNDLENGKKITDLYFDLLKKYPGLDVYVLERTNGNDPYKLQADLLKKEGANFKKFKKNYDENFAVIKKVDDKWNAICQTAAGIEAAMEADKTFSLNQIISKRYYNEFKSYQTAWDFSGYKLTQLKNIENIRIKALSTKNINTYLRCTPQVLKELADKGNFDAQYIYAMHLSTAGSDAQIKQQQGLYLKNAEAGDHLSMLLLFYIRIWQATTNPPVLTAQQASQVFNELTASVAQSNIPAGSLFNLGNHLNAYLQTTQYPQTTIYLNYGRQLKEKYKSK